MIRLIYYLLPLISFLIIADSCNINSKKDSTEKLFECLLSSYAEIMGIEENGIMIVGQTRKWGGEFSYISISPNIFDYNLDDNSGIFITNFRKFKVVFYSGEILMAENKFVIDKEIHNSIIPNSLEWIKLDAAPNFLSDINMSLKGPIYDFSFLYSPKQKCVKFMKNPSYSSIVERIKENCLICN